MTWPWVPSLVVTDLLRMLFDDWYEAHSWLIIVRVDIAGYLSQPCCNHEQSTRNNKKSLRLGKEDLTASFYMEIHLVSVKFVNDYQSLKMYSVLPWNLWYNSHISRQNCWSLRCSWSIAYRRCSNYIFILDWTPGFNRLRKDNCKTRQESIKFWNLVRLILEISRWFTSLVMPYDVIYLGQHQVQIMACCLTAPRNQEIIWTKVESSLIWFRDIHPGQYHKVKFEMSKREIHKKIPRLYLPGDNKWSGGLGKSSSFSYVTRHQ